jgi:hypothetical protein
MCDFKEQYEFFGGDTAPDWIEKIYEIIQSKGADV